MRKDEVSDGRTVEQKRECCWADRKVKRRLKGPHGSRHARSLPGWAHVSASARHVPRPHSAAHALASLGGIRRQDGPVSGESHYCAFAFLRLAFVCGSSFRSLGSGARARGQGELPEGGRYVTDGRATEPRSAQGFGPSEGRGQLLVLFCLLAREPVLPNIGMCATSTGRTL